ncbi:hypothetical protein WN944_018996 [Citrus x changshan-huyou]|uniref:Uncharacterized protein n=1 Tax=Citrus x changshan-huyou TaxID=2935761 RepID=A0AAP0LUE8_9ROSI
MEKKLQNLQIGMAKSGFGFGIFGFGSGCYFLVPDPDINPVFLHTGPERTENDHVVAATKRPRPPRRRYHFRSNVPTLQLLAVLHLLCLLPLVSFSFQLRLLSSTVQVLCRWQHSPTSQLQLIAEPTQRVVAAAMLDSEEQAYLQQALELQSRRLVGLQLLDVQKHHPHRALSTGSPIPSPTHSPSIFYQTFLFPLLHNSSTEPLLGLDVATVQRRGTKRLMMMNTAADDVDNERREEEMVEAMRKMI